MADKHPWLRGAIAADPPRLGFDARQGARVRRRRWRLPEALSSVRAIPRDPIVL
jgi:hypothetical protein